MENSQHEKVPRKFLEDEKEMKLYGYAMKQSYCQEVTLINIFPNPGGCTRLKAGTFHQGHDFNRIAKKRIHCKSLRPTPSSPSIPHIKESQTPRGQQAASRGPPGWVDGWMDR